MESIRARITTIKRKGKCDMYTFALLAKRWTLEYHREVMTERYVRERIRTLSITLRVQVRSFELVETENNSVQPLI